MLGIDYRPVYKWFWKRNKDEKKEAQALNGTKQAALVESKGVIQENETGYVVEKTEKKKRRIFYRDIYEDYETDFDEFSKQLGFDVVAAAHDLVGLPSPD